MLRNHTSLGSRPSRRAFTLIELLVVVAIIALLTSILLPSMSRAREAARAVVCLSNAKQMGYSVGMYSNDQKGILPGPVHNPIYHDTARLQEREAANPSQLWWKLNLPYYVAKYMSDNSGKARIVDELLTCPSVARIKVVKPASNHAVYQLSPGHYVANTGANVRPSSGRREDDCERRERANPNDTHPYHKTWPENYFGWTNIPRSVSELNNLDPIYEQPKRIETIKNQGGEWMVADLWAWDVAIPMVGNVQGGTWPFVGQQTSIYDNGGYKVPTFPYHYTNRSFDPNGRDTHKNSPRLTTGKTNAVYFDGHGATVRIWKGSVNPKFAWKVTGKP